MSRPTSRPTRRPARPGPPRRVRELERAGERLLPVLLLLDDERRVWLPDEPDRERLVLCDRGGEDVRVAMAVRLRDRHSSLPRNTPPALASRAPDQRLLRRGRAPAGRAARGCGLPRCRRGRSAGRRRQREPPRWLEWYVDRLAKTTTAPPAEPALHSAAERIKYERELTLRLVADHHWDLLRIRRTDRMSSDEVLGYARRGLEPVLAEL
ncbi:MAG: hypothetical protein AVDCRST_MAG21-1412 [uncultured Nocardioidaceae bacterium]|uniref:Uncharacterized protein n=1 Tax=uncultured Nocardioidaceae bacterium TaxID=253824 RepID=A0A6J4ND68_9ACTN|nr:MAG: hypothetical protein AVDCRST_MAG21-1412 [uncultured Nocardioidaceae bacterium]